MAKGCQCDRNAVEGYGPSCSERIAELEAELEATDDALNAARAELAEAQAENKHLRDLIGDGTTATCSDDGGAA